jgi:hypothetical protein
LDGAISKLAGMRKYEKKLMELLRGAKGRMVRSDLG